MIIVVLGLPGAGKSAFMAYLMWSNPQKDFISNIKTHKMKNNKLLTRDMIYNKTLVMTKKNGEQVFSYSVNKDFWQDYKKIHGKPVNIIIDEVHMLLNSRQSGKKHVAAALNWLALIRRVLGSGDHEYGSLYMLTQIERRLDVVPKEMSSRFIHVQCFYTRYCHRCGYRRGESNESAEQMYECPVCSSPGHDVPTKKLGHYLEIHEFRTYDLFLGWKYRGQKTYFKHYILNDIAKIFPFYESLTWDSLLED